LEFAPTPEPLLMMTTFQNPPTHKAHPGCKDPPVPPEKQERKVQQDRKERKDQEALPDQKVTRAMLVRQARRDLPVRQDLQAPRDQQ